MKDYSDWEIVEGPDYSDWEMVQDAFSKHEPDYSGKPTTGFGGVWEDAKKIPGNVGSKMWGAIAGLPELNRQLEGLDKQFDTDKGRLGKILLAAMGTGANKAAHAVGNTADYFARKELWPEMDLHPDKFFPRNFNYKEGIGVNDNQLGDELLQGVGELLPFAGAGSAASSLFAHGVGSNEEPFSSALSAPILGKTVEMGARGIGRAAGATRDYVHSLNPEHVAPDVAGNYGNRMQGFRQEYSGILNAPGVRNPSNAPHAFNPATQANRQALQTVMQEGEAYTPRLRQFLENPTAENLHWARSDLDRLIRWVNDHERTALPGMKQARTAARQIVDQLNPIMDWALEGAGPEVAAAYEAIGPRYRADIIAPHPQELINAIRAYERNEIGGHSLLERARGTKNDTYGHRYGEEIPGIHRAVHENWWENAPLAEPLVRLFKKKIMSGVD